MSKVIKILGTGCPKCQRTIAIVEAVVNENKFDVNIVKVDDIVDIMKYDIMATPAVVVNEKVMIKGRIPKKTELIEILSK